MIDLLISGGTIYDGSGGPEFIADIAISDGKISDIGDLSSAQAQSTISAEGKCVCPGFIDVHSHSDTYILLEPSAESKITQGITTEVVGNCGASAAPLTGSARLPSDWASMDYPKPWRTIADYRDRLKEARPAVNIMILVGHNTLHGGVAGYERREVSSSDIAEMVKVLEQALDEGAAGLSTGLLYAPGLFAAEEEVIALCKTVSASDGIYTTHMRNEGSRVVEALDETLRIAQRSGVRTQVSHLKASGRSNWHLLPTILERIHTAQQNDIDVAADRYPYLAGCTDLDVVLPDWAQAGTREEILQRLTEPDSRKRIEEALRDSRNDSDWSYVTIGSISTPEIAEFQGTPLVEAADKMGLHPTEALIEIITKDSLRTSAFFAGLSEENMLQILSEPYVMLGSDASLRATSGPLSTDYPHPRAFGSFPRFLRMVLDKKFIDLPEAIRKITSLPAKQFDMQKRGAIRKSFIADITIFDRDAIRDTATYSDPHGISQGIEAVIVNGRPALRQGTLSGERTGTFIETGS